MIRDGAYCLTAIKPVQNFQYQTMIVDSLSLEVMCYSQSFLDIMPHQYVKTEQPIGKISNAIAEKITKINSIKSGFNLLDNDEENNEENWLKKT